MMASSAVVVLAVMATLVVQCRMAELSCKQIEEVVDGHNTRRVNIAHGAVSGQPAATDMNIMIWDDELAKKASDWADNGQFSHNPDRTVDSSRFETGENLYIYRTTDDSYDLDLDQALEAWFIENKDFDFGPMTSEEFENPDKEIGHYTQMVWSNSVYLGCGKSRTRQDGWTKFLVVCNYGPLGNIIGEKPYQTEGEQQDDLNCSLDDCSKMYGTCYI